MKKSILLILGILFLLSCSENKSKLEVSIECENNYKSKEYEIAFEACLKDAKAGIPLAQTRIGQLYLKGYGAVDKINDFNQGKGIDRNEKEAIAWFTKAAEQGFNHAYLNLYLYYSNDSNIYADAKKAFEWLKKSAENGYVSSYYTLNNCAK